MKVGHTSPILTFANNVVDTILKEKNHHISCVCPISVDSNWSNNFLCAWCCIEAEFSCSTTEKASCWVIIKITQWYQANELLWFDLFHFRCSYCISLPSGHAYQVNLHTAATHTYTSLKENRFPYNNKANACWAELASCNFSWLSHSPTLSKTTEEATIAERHANTNSTG